MTSKIKLLEIILYLTILSYYEVITTCSSFSITQCLGLCRWKNFGTSSQCTDYPCAGRNACYCNNGCIMQGSSCVNDQCEGYTDATTCFNNGCYPVVNINSFNCIGTSECSSLSTVSSCMNDSNCLVSMTNYNLIQCRSPYSQNYCNQFTNEYNCLVNGCYPLQQNCQNLWQAHGSLSIGTGI